MNRFLITPRTDNKGIEFYVIYRVSDRTEWGFAENLEVARLLRDRIEDQQSA